MLNENYINIKNNYNNMEYGEDMSLEELERLEEVKFEIDKNAGQVNDGTCPDCNEKLVKIVENRQALG